ncbi:TNF receptor-associated factor 6-like [Macrosteles quadrilineatus]|uniref:TNF receptor-associated factor 6-like n=1 Tax=Macrosteles quadrilineatus TaxID=74068 RepID=UPI0023E1EC0A|nr:TNF receptor-associated factor 6-like [Macrosteles quadrilineatus]
MNQTRHAGYEQMNGSKYAVEPRFECPICLTCLKDPLLTSCGHRFCQECIQEWLKKQDGLCPIDSQALSITKDLFPDNFTRREIAQQTRNCPVEGCSQLLPLLEIEKHISTAHKESSQQEETILCTFHNFGCKTQVQSVQQLNTHLDTQLHHHLALLASRVSDRHAATSDLKAQEAELWEAPSKNGEQEEDSWKNLLKSLYERIVLLEQSNREQEVQITSMRAQVNRLVEDNENLKYNIPLQFCNGVCVWTVDKFREKYLSMTQDYNRCFYSPAFTTSYVGYRFCARLKMSIENPNYLSLLIHLKQGQFDQALDWPFSGRISFTLVHPTNPDLTIKETMMSRPELEAFKKPSKEISPRGFGYSEFVLLSDVMTKGFLDNDSLVIKIQIQTV